MITLRAAMRTLGRAAMAGLATENGWCWIWGFGPAPRYLYLDPQRGEFRAADADPAAADRGYRGSRAPTSAPSPTS
jgi:hypothetical protein